MVQSDQGLPSLQGNAVDSSEDSPHVTVLPACRNVLLTVTVSLPWDGPVLATWDHSLSPCLGPDPWVDCMRYTHMDCISKIPTDLPLQANQRVPERVRVREKKVDIFEPW